METKTTSLQEESSADRTFADLLLFNDKSNNFEIDPNDMKL